MRFIWRSALAVMAVLAVAACSNDKSSGSKDKDDDTDVVDDSKDIETIDSYQDVQGSAFLVKNNLQLKAAAVACLGEGPGTVGDDMFSAKLCPGNGGTPATGDKLVILGADKCGIRGKNIYDALKDQLWSPDLAGRTDTLGNHLTPSYLQALAVAADVYAHTVENPQALCGDEDKALDLLKRCVSQFDPASLDAAVKEIAGICSKGGVEARQAIATILGSAAFAAAAPSDGKGK